MVYKRGLNVLSIDGEGEELEGVIVRITSPHTLDIDISDSDDESMIREISIANIVEVEGIMVNKPKYYQPRLSDSELVDSDFEDNYVYRHFENAKQDYPNHVIDVLKGDDIERPIYIDDDDGRSIKYYVDIPQKGRSDEFQNAFESFSKDDVLLYARLYYNADANGNINLISNA